MSRSASLKSSRKCSLILGSLSAIAFVVFMGFCCRQLVHASDPQIVYPLTLCLLLGGFTLFRGLDLYLQSPILAKAMGASAFLFFSHKALARIFHQPQLLIHTEMGDLKHWCLIIATAYLCLEVASLVGQFAWHLLPYPAQKQILNTTDTPAWPLESLPLRVKTAWGIVALKAGLALVLLVGTRISPTATWPHGPMALFLLNGLSLLAMSLAVMLFATQPRKSWPMAGLIALAALTASLDSSSLYTVCALIGILMQGALNRLAWPWQRSLSAACLFLLLYLVTAFTLPTPWVHGYDTMNNPTGPVIQSLVLGLTLGFLGTLSAYYHHATWGRLVLYHAGFWILGLVSGFYGLKLVAATALLFMLWVGIVKACEAWARHHQLYVWRMPVKEKIYFNR